MPSQRLKYIDSIKGLCILLICLIHFEKGCFPNWLYAWIGSFMITAFYLTSGWVYALKPQQWSAKNTFRKRLKQLGIPYLWFSALLLAITILWTLIGHLPFSAIPKELFKTICLRGIGTLWFIPALGFGEVIFCFLMSRKVKSHVMLTVLFLALSITSDTLYDQAKESIDIIHSHPIINAIIYPYVCILRAWPMIYLGYWCSRLFNRYLHPNPDKIYRLSVGLTGIVVLATSIFCIIHQPTDIKIINSIVFTSLPTLGFMCVFYSLEGSLIATFFTYWGINSLIMMCTHYTITLEAFKFIDNLIVGTDEFTGVRTLVYFVLCVLFTYPMVTFFNKKAPFFLGKGTVPTNKKTLNTN